MRNVSVDHFTLSSSSSNTHSQEHVAPDTPFCIKVPQEAVGIRLDVFLVSRFSDTSRSYLGQQIQEGAIYVNGSVRKAGYRLKPDDTVTGCFKKRQQQASFQAEEVPFEILWEDDSVLVLSKPPGIVVHPAAGNQTGTLAHGLLFHNKNFSEAGDESRPGIVHRLDKDTSGVMVTAKTDDAHRCLVQQFKARKIKKVYRAIVDGVPEQSGIIEASIGRHPVSRKKMAVRERHGKPASTSWQLLEKLSGNRAYVELKPVTGRTHQLRVHMAFCKTPICGDAVYGRKKSGEECGCTRQMLHAYSLFFQHPKTGMEMEFTAPLWPDMDASLTALRTCRDEPLT